MRAVRYCTLVVLLLGAACAPNPAKTNQGMVPETVRSLVMARLPQNGVADMVSMMQRRLLRAPLAGRVTAHGFAGDGVYTVDFDGTCAGNPELVSAIVQTVRAAGATETSCVPVSVFAPGEPVTFRRGLPER